MAGLITRIIRKFIPLQERRCPACKRTLQKAIDEQLKSQKSCPLEHCAFKKEIKQAIQAILESKTPEVILWSVDKTEILENENITIFWEVLYAKRVIITGLGELPLKGKRNITPRRSTNYTLTIQDYKNNSYEIENTINVKVIPLPIIEIRENKLKIERGDAVVLSWKSTNISKVVLSFDNQIIDVTDLIEITIQPTEHTTFKLIATALDNKTIVEKEIETEVFQKPEIIIFEVLPDVVISSMPVTLSWKVENAKKIEINNGIGEVCEEGYKTVLHEKNTLYQLKAWGELSLISKEIVVTVFPTPIIKSLLVPMPDFKQRISLNSIIIGSPKIDVSIHIPKFNLNAPQITEPDIDLRTITPMYKNKSLIFNFSKIYERIKKRASL